MFSIILSSLSLSWGVVGGWLLSAPLPASRMAVLVSLVCDPWEERWK